MARRGRRGAIEERTCALEGCGRRAKAGSPFCQAHAQSAVGRAARRELQDLLREIERMGQVTEPKLRRRAELRFTRKLASGRYPVLFSQELGELQEERRRNAELGVELGGLRLALFRALSEIDDPSEMARTIVRVSEETRKVVGREGGK